MLGPRAQLAMHSRHDVDRSFAQRVGMLRAAQQSVIALRYSRELSRAFLAKSRGTAADPAQTRFSIGDQVFYWRGQGKKKASWAQHWHGPAV
eukprot:8148258-Lingulodinium_polyedra.AAC.1